MKLAKQNGNKCFGRNGAAEAKSGGSLRGLAGWGIALAMVVVLVLIFLKQRSSPSLGPTDTVAASNPPAVVIAPAPPIPAASAPVTGQTSISNTLPPVGMSTNLSDADKAGLLVNRGSKLVAEGQPAEAVVLFEQAMKINPDDEDVHFNLAIALTRLGKVEAARKEYLEALRLFPDYADAHNNLGNLLASQGNFPEALQHFNAALKAAPDSASAHNNLGSVLARQGNVSVAIEHFLEATRLQTNYVEARFNLGSAYLENGKTALAIEQFNDVLREQPDFRPAQTALERARRKQATER